MSLPDSFRTTLSTLLPDTFNTPIAVACSGGADSMALALLAQRAGCSFTALIVDHGLRPESAAEAQQTADWLAARGIKAHIITLALEAGAGLQERARAARYEAMSQWCKKHSVQHLLLAHHRDDQIETVLFRLLRGSGAHGLSAMSMKRMQGEITLLRPLLSTPKAALIDYLKEHNQDWIEDSSNDNADFARVRIRQWLANHADETQRRRLFAVTQSFGRIRQRDELRLGVLVNQHCELLDSGVVQFNAALLDVSPEEAIALLMRMLTCVNGTSVSPRWQEAEQLYNDLKSAPDKIRSLHHCLIIPHQQQYQICREQAHLPPVLTLNPNSMQRWDRRFVIETSAELPGGVQVAALGAEGLRQINDQLSPPPDLNRRVLLSLPAVWHLEAPVFVPHIPVCVTQSWPTMVKIRFAPAKPLAEAPFFIMNESQSERI